MNEREAQIQWQACLAAVEALRNALDDGRRWGNSRSQSSVVGETTECTFTVFGEGAADRFVVRVGRAS